MASSSWKSAASPAMWNVLKYNLPCPYLPAGRLILLGKVDEPSFYITDFPPLTAPFAKALWPVDDPPSPLGDCVVI